MKNLINGMLVASVFSVGIAGCTQDKTSELAPEGEQTLVEIVFQVPSASQPAANDGTRAPSNTTDGNAKLEETEIKSADVFMYSGNGDFLSRTALTPSDFNNQSTNSAATGSGYDEYASTKQIPTTTGTKHFLVGINLPSTVSSTIVGKPMGAAATEIQTMTRSLVNLTNGLPMFNLTGPTQAEMTEQVAPATNTVTVKVERIVSKVTVEKSPTMTQTGTVGSIGPLTWAVNNTNTKFFLTQGTAAVYADPNWTAAQYNAADFERAADADYVAVNDGPQSSAAAYNAQYAMENTSENKLQKELTRVTVKAPFAPAQWVTTGTAWTAPADPANSPNSNYVAGGTSTYVTFYVVTPAVGATPRYFQDATDANRYAGEKGVTAATHTGGVCYWNFWVNTNNRKGEMLRNEYYKANIISIQAPGRADDSVTGPDSVVPTSTSVTATVQILNWLPVPMEDKELVP